MQWIYCTNLNLINRKGDELSLCIWHLAQGESNHHLLVDARFLGGAELTRGYALYDLGAYPGAVVDESSAIALYGEVYQVDTATFEALDRLEEYPTGIHGNWLLPLMATLGIFILALVRRDAANNLG